MEGRFDVYVRLQTAQWLRLAGDCVLSVPNSCCLSMAYLSKSLYPTLRHMVMSNVQYRPIRAIYAEIGLKRTICCASHDTLRTLSEYLHMFHQVPRTKHNLNQAIPKYHPTFDGAVIISKHVKYEITTVLFSFLALALYVNDLTYINLGKSRRHSVNCKHV